MNESGPSWSNENRKKIFVIRTVSLRFKNWACLQFGKYYTISPKPIVNPKTPIEILHRTNTLREGPMTPIELYNSNFLNFCSLKRCLGRMVSKAHYSCLHRLILVLFYAFFVHWSRTEVWHHLQKATNATNTLKCTKTNKNEGEISQWRLLLLISVIWRFGT